MIVSFDTWVAKEIGVKEAILLFHIAYWLKRNEAMERNIHDGKVWTYSTQKDLAKALDFLSEKQVRTAMATLKDRGLIETANYNKLPYDRTLWYTLTSEGRRMTNMDNPSTLTGAYPYDPAGTVPSVREVAPIPNNITNKITNKYIAPTKAEVQDYIKAQGYHFNSDEFYDYYASANWHKADGKPVRNWKQCCVTWESTWKKDHPNATQTTERRKKLL